MVLFYHVPTYPVLIRSVAMLWGYLRSLSVCRAITTLSSGASCVRISRLSANGQAGRNGRVSASRAHLWPANHAATNQ